jgi:polyhydroxyalkanoate synthesis regulator phasin
MAARKRASSQSKLLNRAVKAGRSALLQAQRRLPPDVRKQIDRTVKEGQKTIHVAIKQVESRLDRTARQADLEKAMKRLDELTRQVRNIASAAAASAAQARAAGPRPATRKAATRKASTRRKPAGAATTRKAAPARRATRRTTRRPGRPAPPASDSQSDGS